MTNLCPTSRRNETASRHTAFATRARGFSLIEMLVVIAIIAVIAGLLLMGISKLQEGGKEAHARTLLTNLLGNSGQYENSAGKRVLHLYDKNDSIYLWNQPKRTNAPDATGSFVITGDDYDNVENNGNYTYSNGDTNDLYMQRANMYIERFIWAANQMPDIRKNLPALGASFVDSDGDGFMEVVDPWGNPVAYAKAVDHDPGTDEDDFLPEYNGPFFASAGEDQMWGIARRSGEFASKADWDAYKETDEYKFTLDNLYSFDLDRAAAKRGD